jgi:hypothetical protein
LRAFTGLAVLGSVTMNWTPPELRKRRRGHLGFGAAAAALLLSYSGVMAASLLH